MTKELEALEKVKRTIKAELAKLDLMGFEKSDKYNYLEQLLDDLTEVEKSLKALEIIKKNFEFGLFEEDKYKVYIYSSDDDYSVVKRISEEEFNTLKEVLK